MNVCILIKCNQPVAVFDANKYLIVLYLLLSTEVRSFHCFLVQSFLFLELLPVA